MRISDWSSDVCSSDLAQLMQPDSTIRGEGLMKSQSKFIFRRAPYLLVSASMLAVRSEEHTSKLQSLMRISYAVFCLKRKIYLLNSRRRRRNNRKENALISQIV